MHYSSFRHTRPACYKGGVCGEIDLVCMGQDVVFDNYIPFFFCHISGMSITSSQSQRPMKTYRWFEGSHWFVEVYLAGELWRIEATFFVVIRDRCGGIISIIVLLNGSASTISRRLFSYRWLKWYRRPSSRFVSICCTWSNSRFRNEDGKDSDSVRVITFKYSDILLTSQPWHRLDKTI